MPSVICDYVGVKRINAEGWLMLIKYEIDFSASESQCGLVLTPPKFMVTTTTPNRLPYIHMRPMIIYVYNNGSISAYSCGENVWKNYDGNLGNDGVELQTTITIYPTDFLDQARTTIDVLHHSVTRRVQIVNFRLPVLYTLRDLAIPFRCRLVNLFASMDKLSAPGPNVERVYSAEIKRKMKKNNDELNDEIRQSMNPLSEFILNKSGRVFTGEQTFPTRGIPQDIFKPIEGTGEIFPDMQAYFNQS